MHIFLGGPMGPIQTHGSNTVHGALAATSENFHAHVFQACIASNTKVKESWTPKDMGPWT